MKIRIIILLVFIGSSFFSCETPSQEESILINPDAIDIGDVKAQKNGEEWIANVEALEPSRIEKEGLSIIFTVRDHRRFKREQIGFLGMKRNFDKQVISTIRGLQSSSFNTALDDGDVLGDSYDVDETATDNFFQFVSIDRSNNTIQGKFNITYKLFKDSPADPALAPEKITFSDAEFTAKVDPSWFD